MHIVYALTVLAGVVSGARAIDEAKKTDKPSAARALDVKVEGTATGRFGDPVVIDGPEALAKAIHDEAAVAAVNKAVEFKTEKVVYFSWLGSGQDKVAVEMAEGKKGPVVTFTYTAGKTRDVRPHKKLFAVPKDAEVRISK